MAIGSAVQRNNMVYIYDENGAETGGIGAGFGPEDGLKGYTSTTVSIRRGRTIYLYNEKGYEVGSIPASTKPCDACLLHGPALGSPSMRDQHAQL